MMEMMPLPCAVTPDQRQAARREVVRQMEQGMTATEARRTLPVPMHRTTVYRLLKRVEREGEQALAERRHGYPTKLRGEVLTWMLDYCQNHRTAASREVQRLVAERFGLSVSVSQLNRVRAAHGLSRQAPPREKTPKTGLMIASAGSHGKRKSSASSLQRVSSAKLSLLKGIASRRHRIITKEPDTPTCPHFLLTGLSSLTIM